MAKKLMRCSICAGPIAVQLGGWTGGHNAEPVNHGRCCDECNASIVVPARIYLIVRGFDPREVPQRDDNSEHS